MEHTVDLRSDTVTLPSARMRRAMAEAVVGDDVYGEDPTLARLEATAAELLGYEAALFVPTGTMGNQIAIRLHTHPGSEAIVECDCHVYRYELAAMAAWSGVLPRVIQGRRGRIEPEQVRDAVSPPVYYYAPTKLLVLENTHNHAGGTVLSMDRRDTLLAVAREAGLSVHLDGARIFNAATALGRPADEVAAGFDSVMFSLSKGLGAPVGSILCGSRDLVRAARVERKRMGGGMRQAGVLAAAGLVALEDHRGRLDEDHRRARELASVMAELDYLRIDPAEVETNIVIAEVVPPAKPESVVEGLARQGIRAGTWGPSRIRLVTHLDIGDEALRRASEAFRSLA